MTSGILSKLCVVLFFSLFIIIVLLKALCQAAKRYLGQLENAFDLVKLGLSIRSALDLADWRDTSGQRAVFAACCMLQWLKLAWCFRAFEVIGPRIYAILYTLRDTALIAFLTLVGFVTAGFVHAFYVLGTSSGPAPVYAAFLEVFRLNFILTNISPHDGIVLFS